MSELQEYQLKFDEIHALVAASYEQEAPEQTVEYIKSVLINGYIHGLQAAEEMLEWEMFVDFTLLNDALFYRIDGLSFEDRAYEHINAGRLGELQRLAETEFHRMWNTGLFDGSKQYQEKTGKAVVKTWYTMRDPFVRETHDYLEGVTVGLNEYFVTFDKDRARFPGDFQFAQNNVNCRCWIELSRV